MGSINGCLVAHNRFNFLVYGMFSTDSILRKPEIIAKLAAIVALHFTKNDFGRILRTVFKLRRSDAVYGINCLILILVAFLIFDLVYFYFKDKLSINSNAKTKRISPMQKAKTENVSLAAAAAAKVPESARSPFKTSPNKIASLTAGSLARSQSFSASAANITPTQSAKLLQPQQKQMSSQKQPQKVSLYEEREYTSPEKMRNDVVASLTDSSSAYEKQFYSAPVSIQQYQRSPIAAHPIHSTVTPIIPKATEKKDATEKSFKFYSFEQSVSVLGIDYAKGLRQIRQWFRGHLIPSVDTSDKVGMTVEQSLELFIKFMDDQEQKRYQTPRLFSSKLHLVMKKRPLCFVYSSIDETLVYACSDETDESVFCYILFLAAAAWKFNKGFWDGIYLGSEGIELLQAIEGCLL
jgi:hypothetical protein